MELINSGRWQSILYGYLHKGAVLGNHYHKKTDIFFFVLTGQVVLTYFKKQARSPSAKQLKPLEGMIIPRGFGHAVRALEETTFILAKSRIYTPSNPDIYPVEVVLS